MPTKMRLPEAIETFGRGIGVSVFALDLENQLLLIPGVDVVVDVSKHELGLIPVLL